MQGHDYLASAQQTRNIREQLQPLQISMPLDIRISSYCKPNPFFSRCPLPIALSLRWRTPDLSKCEWPKTYMWRGLIYLSSGMVSAGFWVQNGQAIHPPFMHGVFFSGLPRSHLAKGVGRRWQTFMVLKTDLSRDTKETWRMWRHREDCTGRSWNFSTTSMWKMALYATLGWSNAPTEQLAMLHMPLATRSAKALFKSISCGAQSIPSLGLTGLNIEKGFRGRLRSVLIQPTGTSVCCVRQAHR